MSHNPRKLNFGENRHSSARKSRLPVITEANRRASSAQRSSSINQPGAMKRSRSSELTTLTRYGSDSSLNTPGRYGQSSMTPLHLPRVSMATMDRSRRAIQEKSIQILNFLQSDDHFFESLNLQQNLTSLSAKQFNLIIQFLIKNICGKVPPNFNTDAATCIVDLLKMLRCPYQINKSMLKAPNAPHSINQIIILLHWMCQFVDGSIKEEAKLFADPELPSLEFTRLFSKQTELAYQLWNSKQDDKLDELNTNLCHELLAVKTDGKVKTFEELDAKTDAMKKKTIQLKKKGIIIPHEEEHNAWESNYARKEEIAVDLENQIIRKTDQLAALEPQYKEKKSNFNQIKDQIENWREIVEIQKYNLQQLQATSQQIHEVEIELDLLRRETDMLQDNLNGIVIKIAQIQHRKGGKLHELNELSLKINQLFGKLKAKIPSPIAGLNFEMKTSAEDFQQLKKKLKKFSAIISSQTKAIKHQLECVEGQLKMVRIEETENKLKLKNSIDLLCEKANQFDKEQQKMVEKNRNAEKMLTQKSNQIHELNYQLSQVKQEKIVHEARLQAYKDDIQKVKERCEENFLRIRQMKLELLDRLNKTIDLVDEDIEAKNRIRRGERDDGLSL